MLYILLVILFLAIFSCIVGILLGLLLTDSNLQDGLKVIAKTFLRITKKKFLRLINPDIDLIRVQRDHAFLSLPGDRRAALVDIGALEAVSELKQRLCSRYGNKVAAVYMFGSRVRGDYQSESDVDVGIFLVEPFDRYISFKKETLRISAELLLKYGLFIQSRIFCTTLSGNLMNATDKYLAEIIISYGNPV
jgi:predicted nucleotidyltransferase